VILVARVSAAHPGPVTQTRVRCAYPGYKSPIKMGSSFRWNDGVWVVGVAIRGPEFAGMMDLKTRQ